jgi:prepilin-type N-terminal cleavage/methylation domain-containing protein
MRLSLKKGFTVLEVLVVIAIIGILAAVAVYSLSVTRASNRDAKRISDISVLRAALSQHWLQKATYPQSEKVDLGRPGAEADKLTGNGFVGATIEATPVFMLQVPVGPKAGEKYVLTPFDLEREEITPDMVYKTFPHRARSASKDSNNVIENF